MRVAVLTTSYPRHEGDPAGHFVQAEVDALRASGCDVEVFAAQGSAFGWPGVVPRLREAPLREVTTYARTLSSMTGGQGSFTMEFSHYEVMPGNIQQDIISKAKLHEEEEE